MVLQRAHQATKYAKVLGIQDKVELMSARRTMEQPKIIQDYTYIYYTEPSFAPLQAHQKLFPRWAGKNVTYIGTPSRHRNSAMFEFILRMNPSIHYWDPNSVFQPDVMSYLMNSISPDIFRNEILALP